MERLEPTIRPEGLSIRIYDEEESVSDSETDASSQVSAADSEAVASHDGDLPDGCEAFLAARLQENKAYINDRLGSMKTRTRTPLNRDKDYTLIISPTVSKIHYQALNPYIYKTIRDVEGLDGLAKLLMAPEDWMMYYAQVIGDDSVLEGLADLKNVDENEPEACVQLAFVHLVRSISDILDIQVVTKSEIKFMVGGILANHALDVRGASDPHFRNKKGQYLIASEVKTKKTFLDGEDGQLTQPNQRWYQRSRGIQVLSTLYTFNSPTFLLTQAHWKLFAENSERNAIFTFPHGPTTTEESFFPPRLVHPMDETFVKAIVICLLSNRDALEQEMIKVAEARASETAAKQASSSRSPLNLPSSQKGSSNWPVSSETIPQGQGPVTERVSPPILEPVFVSGYDEYHKPIYLPVRVYPPEVVAQEEEEIIDQEKMEALATKSSTMTLVE